MKRQDVQRSLEHERSRSSDQKSKHQGDRATAVLVHIDQWVKERRAARLDALTRKLAQSNIGKNASDPVSLVDELAGKYFKRQIKHYGWGGAFERDEVKSQTYIAVRAALEGWDPSKRSPRVTEEENLRQFLEREAPRHLDQWRNAQIGAVSTSRDIRRTAEATLREAAGVSYIDDLSISKVRAGSRRIMPKVDSDQEERSREHYRSVGFEQSNAKGLEESDDVSSLDLVSILRPPRPRPRETSEADRETWSTQSHSRRPTPVGRISKVRPADARVVGKLHDRLSEPIANGDTKLIQARIKQAKKDLHDLRFAPAWTSTEHQSVMERMIQRQFDLAYWERQLAETKRAKQIVDAESLSSDISDAPMAEARGLPRQGSCG